MDGRAKIIAFANQKGGVAKTTTTLNLAAAFAEEGHRVLCVDMDPQGNLTMSQGIDPDSLEQSMYDVLVHKVSIREVIRKREIDIACASIDLAGAEIAMAPMIGRERALQRAFEPILEDYDFICIDTPPSLGLLTINALTAADKVIVPVQCEYLSMRGLIQLQNTLSMIRENLNPDVDIEGILPTLVDSRTIHAKEAIEILEENFGDRVFASRIRKTVRFAEAPVKGMSVLKYDPDGVAAQSYRDLAQEVLAMANPKRASMREGPLAALFRKTEEPENGGSRAPRRERGAGARPGGRPRAARRPIAPASQPERRAAAPRSRSRSRAARAHAAGAAARGLLLRAPREHARAPAARRRDGAAATDVYARGDDSQPAAAPPSRWRSPGCASSASAAPASTRSTGWSRPRWPASSSSPSTPTCSRCSSRTADVTVHIGPQVTRGPGLRRGRRTSAVRPRWRSTTSIKSLLKGSDMIFITAGAGGGTGTGAAPIIARIAREVGALTVAIVTKPFGFEGTRRASRPTAASRRSPPRSTR